MESIDFRSGAERTTAISPIRVVAVTLGLVGAGALLGGLSGALALAAAMSLRHDWMWVADFGFPVVAGCFGAVVGGVIAPVTSWVFLRNVPLGRAMLRTTMAAALGGAVTGALLLESILWHLRRSLGGRATSSTRR